MNPRAKSQNAGKRHNLVPGTFQTILIFPDMVKKLVDGQKSNHVSRLYQFCWNKYHIEVKATMKLNQKLLHICNIGIILQEVI